MQLLKMQIRRLEKHGNNRCNRRYNTDVYRRRTFANSFKTNYDAGGIDAVIDNGMKELLVNADITMVNEEFPFSNRGTQMEDKQYTFRTDPSYAAALKKMGVDVVTLANNHILDYGREALSDTFTTLDGQGILYAGAGDSVERAQEVQVIEVNGKSMDFLQHPVYFRLPAGM